LTSPLNINYEDGRKLIINKANARTFNVSRVDDDFMKTLIKSDILLPDGVGTLFAVRLLLGLMFKKISGFDLFVFEMEKLNLVGRKCFFLGSSENVLNIIMIRASREYANIKIDFYLPPFKSQFSIQDSVSMINSAYS